MRLVTLRRRLDRGLATAMRKATRSSYSTQTSSEPPRRETPYYFSSNQPPVFTEETQRRLERLRQHRFHPSNMPDSPDFGTNQHMMVDEQVKEQLKAIVAGFHAPIRYAFAYGSGLYRQDTTTRRPAMLDFIFGVSYPEHWHALNMQQHPHHYSALRHLGHRTLSLIQNSGAGVYFNPYVGMDGMMIKYGVVSVDTLCQDLLDWDSLYLAGRMHKPIKILRDDARVRLANQVNLTEAVRVALLSLPETFDQETLYQRIAGISYVGDLVGQPPDKIQSMVRGRVEHYHRLYSAFLDDLPNVALLPHGRVQQHQDPKYRGLMVQKLPKALHRYVTAEHARDMAAQQLELPSDPTTLGQHIASSPRLVTHIDQGLYHIIAKTAFSQSVKGIFTAGPVKSSRYTMEKLTKWWSSSKR